jgi:hypothetical protein
LINLDKTQQTLIENGYNQLYKFKYRSFLYSCKKFYAIGPKNTVFLEYEKISFEWKFSNFFDVQNFGLKVFISSYSGKQWQN